MGFDFYAEYPCISEIDVRRIVGDDRVKDPYTELEDIYTRVDLLAQSIVADAKEYAKSGHYKYGGGYKGLLHNRKGINTYTAELIKPRLKILDDLGIYPPSIDINALPKYSFYLQFEFRLSRPFHSGGDAPFYIHENPVSKELVFKVPMVRSSTWKGHLRSVATLMGYSKKFISRVFGDVGPDNDPDNEGLTRKGRIRAYPTFFDSIGLEIMNPHDRKTKAGTVPIMLEVAPRGARGYFTLLYFPFDLIGVSEQKAAQQVTEDAQALAKIIRSMMLTYGFSAKKNKGFGQASVSFVRRDGKEEAVTGKFAISGVKIPEEAKETKKETQKTIPDWQRKLQAMKESVPSEASNEVTIRNFNGLQSVIRKVCKNIK